MFFQRRNPGRKSTRKVKTKREGLRFEPLEARQMMAVFPVDVAIGNLPTLGLVDGGGPPPDYISVVNEFNLNSKPGAPATLFLDFNGHYQTERVGDWHGFGGWDNILTPAFDRDGDAATFSPSEQQEIRFIWATVAEDYAPFNINVTTVDPDPGSYHTDDPYLRVVVSGSKDTITGRHLNGFAEIGAYADDGGANVAYVFSHDSANVSLSAKYIADSASHEAGHSFGLEHQSQYNSSGKKVKEYRPGNGERGPIMGQVSSVERGTWSKGPIGPGITLGFPSTGYIAVQDDMATIASSSNGFGYRADDHAGSLAGAAQLTPTNIGLYGKGVIEKTSDADMFKFTTGGGNVTVNLQLPQERQRPGEVLRNIGNLDASLRLYDSAGVMLAQDSDPTLLASLSANVGAGTYYVRVGSYGVYGDVGQYTLVVNETTGPQIVSSRYASLSSALGSLLVTFDEPVDAATFSAQDVRINGAAAGVGVVSIGVPTNGSKSFLITFTKPGTVRTNISIGPNINDWLGNRMDQNRNGVAGEASDYYMTSLFLVSVTDGIGTTPGTVAKTKGVALTSRSADAYFLSLR